MERLPLLILLALTSAGCGGTATLPEPEREAPQTIEAKVGAQTYTCTRLPDEIAPGPTAPVYRCR